MGYLGPNEEDNFFTVMDSKKKMYSTIILANIIATILDE